jgi:peptidylprolyl isomerase
MGAATQINKLLCDDDCLAKLDGLETQETKSGLRYKDIVVGKGPTPPTGYQALTLHPQELLHAACSLKHHSA